MAYALGSLNPSICARLEEAESLLADRTDTHVLSQVLLEEGLITQDNLNKLVCCHQAK